MRKKILSNKGETLTEVLVALLISTISLTMLAAMITSSQKILKDGTVKMQEYYAANERMAVAAKNMSGTDYSVILYRLNKETLKVAKSDSVGYLTNERDSLKVNVSVNKMGDVDVVRYVYNKTK